jgi:hypothetical protein
LTQIKEANELRVLLLSRQQFRNVGLPNKLSFAMRSTILIFLASVAFATTARAQSAWLERDMVSAVCSREAAPAAGERLAGRLNLTAAQNRR